MAFINYDAREINLKIVLAGPEGSGKVEVAQFIYDSVPEWNKEKLLSFTGSMEPILVFNFLVPSPKIRGFKVRPHIYTFTSQSESAQLILKGLEAIILVLDTASPMERNRQFIQRLGTQLERLEYRLENIPLVALICTTNDEECFTRTHLKQLLKLRSLPILEVSEAGPQGVLDSVEETLRLSLAQFTKGIDEKGLDFSKPLKIPWIAGATLNLSPEPIPRSWWIRFSTGPFSIVAAVGSLILWVSAWALLFLIAGAVSMGVTPSIMAAAKYMGLKPFLALLVILPAVRLALWMFFRRRRKKELEPLKSLNVRGTVN